MVEGAFRSFIGAPRTPEYRALPLRDRFTLDLHYMTVKWAGIVLPASYVLVQRYDPPLAEYPTWLRETILRPATKRFRCRPGTFLHVFTMAAFLVNHIHNCRQLARYPEKNMNILRFLEQDRGFVPMVTMMFIPKDKRWSALTKIERLSGDFVTEEQCRQEATTAIFSPQLAYEHATVGLPEEESPWERVRRESE